MDMSLNKLWETVKDKEACSAAVHVVAKSQPPNKRNKAVYIFKYPGEKGNSQPSVLPSQPGNPQFLHILFLFFILPRWA